LGSDLTNIPIFYICFGCRFVEQIGVGSVLFYNDGNEGHTGTFALDASNASGELTSTFALEKSCLSKSARRTKNPHAFRLGSVN
jgi:hypothetical protein